MKTLPAKFPSIKFNVLTPNVKKDKPFWYSDKIFQEVHSTPFRIFRYNQRRIFFMVNYYFKKLYEFVHNTYPRTDIYITIEDDQLCNKDALSMIWDMVNEHSNDNICYYKAAIKNDNTYYGYDKGFYGNKYHEKSYHMTPLYGNWGIIRTKDEIERFHRYMKFAYQSSCNDELSYLYCYINNQRIFVDARISYHFGWMTDLPP